MKTSFSLGTLLAAAACLATNTFAADSKRTAEYILSTPLVYEGKDVTLDVAFVKPVHWKSPIPELAFFHVLTMDRSDKKPGGGILVAIPAEEAEKFVKKYGMDFEGRSDSDALKGILVTAPSRGPKGKIWLVDTSGKAVQLFTERKVALIDEGEGSGQGERRGPRRPGPQ